jgi:hypothetical protein
VQEFLFVAAFPFVAFLEGRKKGGREGGREETRSM